MQLFKEVCTSSLGLPSDTFTLAIVPWELDLGKSQFGFLVASSDSSVTSIEYSRGKQPTVTIKGKQNNVHKNGITCLQVLTAALTEQDDSSAAISAGRDGTIKVWDILSFARLLTLETPNGQGVSAVSHYHASDDASTVVAAGTELLSDAPGNVAIYVWTCLKPLSKQAPSESQLILSIVDSHTDTITNLLFHISRPADASRSQEPSSALHTVHLISSGADGLINIIDPNISEEEDAILTVLNNRSGVHHFCATNGPDHRFLTSGQVLAISEDEKMSVHAVSDSTSETEAVDPMAVDLRQALRCDYAIGLKRVASRQGTTLALGAYKENDSETPCEPLYLGSRSTSHFRAHLGSRRTIASAHGEEIVRDVWLHGDYPFVLTCGEDGHVRIWEEDVAPSVPMPS